VAITSEQNWRPMNAKEKWIGAGIGAAAVTALAIIVDAFYNPQNINNQPFFWTQVLLYSFLAGAGALTGAVITSDGRIQINRTHKSGPLR